MPCKSIPDWDDQARPVPRHPDLLFAPQPVREQNTGTLGQRREHLGRHTAFFPDHVAGPIDGYNWLTWEPPGKTSGFLPQACPALTIVFQQLPFKHACNTARHLW